eukprot:scpid96475/ scgid3816/ 
MSRYCCGCGKKGRCVNCSCVSAGKKCVNCSASRHGACQNQDLPSATSLPSSCPAGIWDAGKSCTGTLNHAVATSLSQPTDSVTCTQHADDVLNDRRSTGSTTPSGASPSSAASAHASDLPILVAPQTRDRRQRSPTSTNTAPTPDVNATRAEQLLASVVASHAVLPDFPPSTNPVFKWGDVHAGSFVPTVERVYAKTSNWQRNLFSLPSGSASKDFVREMARLLHAYASKSALE